MKKGQTLIIEDENLEQFEITPKEFKQYLKPVDGELKISLVVMDKLNCSEFCDVLIELGVAHVISFEIKNDENI